MVLVAGKGGQVGKEPAGAAAPHGLVPSAAEGKDGQLGAVTRAAGA